MGESNQLGGIMEQRKNDNADNYPVRIDQPFFNLKQAWRIKGCACAWNTFERTRFIQPRGGIFDEYVAGRGVFTNETIHEWLYLADREMESYNRKYQTGAKPKNKIKKGRRLEALS